MEGQAVINAENAIRRSLAQAMPALAIGVVCEHVENRELEKRVDVVFEQREVMLLGVVIDEALH